MIYLTLTIFTLALIFAVWETYQVYYLKEISLIKILPLYLYIKWTRVLLWEIEIRLKIIKWWYIK